MILETIKNQILQRYQEMQSAGELPTNEQLDGYHRVFSQKFGPEVLSSLDGEALLNLIHGLGTRDSLVYWLEFKNDADFPAIFGSIAGGSALKYGLFRRRETGTWVIGSPQKQVEISVEQAVEIARRHRDQLIRGVSIIQSMPDTFEDAAYQKLQVDLTREAPDVENTSWGHKYFHMLCPKIIDDYHVASFQRFYLIKMLQLPPEGDGRYICAGRFIAMAQEFSMPVGSFTTILNELHGRPYSYWRINIQKEQGQEKRWEQMQQENIIALGWEKLGDLSWLEYNQESKKKLRALVQEQYGNDNVAIGMGTANVFNFAAAIREGDLVLASNGGQVLGVGRVAGSYQYKQTSELPHQRPIQWLSFDSWDLPEEEASSNGVHLIRQGQNMIAAEGKILGKFPITATYPQARTEKKNNAPRLEGIPGRIQSVLDRKRQIILYGPPGTGKTYWAMRTANDLAAFTLHGKPYSELSSTEKDPVLGQNGLVRRCTFHPAYGYEDFIEGYRPVSTNGQLAFEKRPGIFKTLCEDAQKSPDRPFYLIIDEINRGDIPRIFGELLTLLEKDKRGQPMLLPLSGSLFQVPENVYLIGTMNTADRSIALLDTALRRRFGFIELMPDSRLLDISIEGLPLGPWLDTLNERIRTHIGRDARNLQIGHAYFLEGGKPVNDKGRFIRILREDILPLLEEYCYEDYDTLGSILGSRLIDLKGQRFNEDLLTLERWDQLLEALLAMDPDLMTSSKVLKAQQSDSIEHLPVEPGEEDVNNGDGG